MKSGKGLHAHIISTSFVVCSLIILLAGSHVKWLDSGTEEGVQIAGYMQGRTPVLAACCIFLAVGVILLSWYSMRLAGAITSIARLFEHDRPGNRDENTFRTIFSIAKADELCTAVRNRLNDTAADVPEYERQIHDLQIQIQLSQKRERNTEAIIYSIRDAVIVIDEYDKVLMANEAAGRLFNFDFSNSQHRLLSELIAKDKGEFINSLRRCRQGRGQATRKEISFVDGDETRTFDCIISCVYDQNRQICGVVAVLHDKTREKQVQEMKNDFVSHVSHELKTPLASITAYSEMLVDGETNDEETRKEFYSVIQNQAQRLNRLIEDILNTSRIESGLIKVNKEPLSLTMVIEEQMKMIKSYAEDKNIKIVGRKPIVFDQVYADKDMISQVIVNLLSNAVKYTPSGGMVKIETEVDDAASLVRVRVVDTGVGIPEDEIEHVFDKFYRVGANNKQAKGTGLGLNLVKQIVEKVHGGRVFVTSQVGKGSTFGFELPQATQHAGSAA